MDIYLNLFLLDQTTPALNSLACPPSDSNVVVSHSTMSHFLSLDLLSLSSSQKDAFCVALAVLESTSQVPESKVFISEPLAETSSIFSSMDCAVKYTLEIIFKLDALKGKKMEFNHSLLFKKQTTQILSELGVEYDALK